MTTTVPTKNNEVVMVSSFFLQDQLLLPTAALALLAASSVPSVGCHGGLPCSRGLQWGLLRGTMLGSDASPHSSCGLENSPRWRKNIPGDGLIEKAGQVFIFNHLGILF